MLKKAFSLLIALCLVFFTSRVFAANSSMMDSMDNAGNTMENAVKGTENVVKDGINTVGDGIKDAGNTVTHSVSNVTSDGYTATRTSAENTR